MNGVDGVKGALRGSLVVAEVGVGERNEAVVLWLTE